MVRSVDTGRKKNVLLACGCSLLVSSWNLLLLSQDLHLSCFTENGIDGLLTYEVLSLPAVTDAQSNSCGFRASTGPPSLPHHMMEHCSAASVSGPPGRLSDSGLKLKPGG